MALTADDCDDEDATSTIVADDADCDGVLTANDCDDTVATTHPGADETCDGVDNDCDGTVDEDHAIDAAAGTQTRMLTDSETRTRATSSATSPRAMSQTTRTVTTKTQT